MNIWLKIFGYPMAIALGLAALQGAVKNKQSKAQYKEQLKNLHDQIEFYYPEFRAQ